MAQAVASRYAQALADAVLGPNSKSAPAETTAELQTFEQMFQTSPELRNMLLSPAVPSIRKRAVISRFAGVVPLSRLTTNFLFVLVDHHRIDILGDIRDAFETVLDARLGIVRADVQSATELSPERRQALQAELSRLTGKQVRCSFAIDPNLIGGVLARIGSTVYDGSVRAQLATLRERLVKH